MNKKRFALVFISLMILGLFSNVSAIDLPEGYSSDADLDSVWVYDILDSNGKVMLVVEPETFTYGDIALEVGGTIEVLFLSFHNNEPYFNISFKLADGTVNRTIANVSNSMIADGLILTLGYNLLVFGFLTTSTQSAWESKDTIANDIADGELAISSEWGVFYYNGSLDISESNNVKTYDYMQDPATGSQNSTFSINQDTGVLQSFSTEAFGYNLSAKLQVSQGINGFPTIFVGFMMMLGIVAVMIKKRR